MGMCRNAAWVRPMWSALLAAAVFSIASVPRALAHGELVYRLPDAPAPTNVKSPYLEHSYRAISDLAYRFPTDRQAEALAKAEAIYAVVWAWRPSPPTADEVARVTASTRSFLRDLRRDYPTFRVAWRGTSVSLLASAGRIRLAAGIERCLLVEVINQTDTPRALAPRTDLGGPMPAMAAIEPGAERTFVVPVRGEGSGVRRVRLEIAAEQPGPAAPPVTLTAVVDRPARLSGAIVDSETGAPTAARVTVRGSDGILRHGIAYAANATLSEKPVVFRPASYKLPFFYSDGRFEVDIPPGRAVVTFARGFEHLPVTRAVDAPAGGAVTVSARLSRSIEMRRLGWISGDTHVHWVKNTWDVNEELSLLGMVQRAEDLCVINNLTLYQYRPLQQGGAFVKPDQYPMGPVPGMCDSRWHVQMAEEYRNDNHYGHINLLGLRRLIEPIATGAGSGGAPGTPDWPTNRPVIAETRRQGGISIEAHNLGPFNASAVAANVVLGLSDSLDQLDPEHYYRFLNCGIHIGLSNGSDHPARVVGCARVYARMPGRDGRPLPFSYDRWIDAVRRGRTFTTSGPILLLSVGGREPGDVWDVRRGQPLTVTVRAVSRYPLGTVEIISNGDVLTSVRTTGRRSTIRLRVRADQSRWFCARASRNGVWNAILAKDVAHTSAVYTRIGGREVLKAEDARFWKANVQEHIRRLEATGVFANERQNAQAVAEAHEGIVRYEEIARKAEGGG